MLHFAVGPCEVVYNFNDAVFWCCVDIVDDFDFCCCCCCRCSVGLPGSDPNPELSAEPLALFRICLQMTFQKKLYGDFSDVNNSFRRN